MSTRTRRARIRWAWPGLLAAATAMACDAPGAGPSPPSGLPAQTGQADLATLDVPFAFASSREARSQDIFVVDRPGAEPRRLTKGRAPDWSRTGWIAFDAVGGRPSPATGIYVIHADGSGERYIGEGYHPSWSPDGRQLAVTRFDGIYVLDVDGVEPARLVARTPHGYESAHEPAWSPDGELIAFSAGTGRSDQWDVWTDFSPVYVVPADGSGPPVLLGGDNATDLAWSPTGAQIAYVTGSTILVLEVSSRAVRQVGTGSDPAWSPDGRLVFTGSWYGAGGRSFGSRILVSDRGLPRLLVPELPAAPNPRYSDYEVTVRR